MDRSCGQTGGSGSTGCMSYKLCKGRPHGQMSFCDVFCLSPLTSPTVYDGGSVTLVATTDFSFHTSQMRCFCGQEDKPQTAGMTAGKPSQSWTVSNVNTGLLSDVLSWTSFSQVHLPKVSRVWVPGPEEEGDSSESRRGPGHSTGPQPGLLLHHDVLHRGNHNTALLLWQVVSSTYQVQKNVFFLFGLGTRQSFWFWSWFYLKYPRKYSTSEQSIPE